MSYSIYVTLEPIVSIKSYEKSYLSDVQCGFQTNKPIAIDSLVCANINKLSIKEFFSRRYRMY